MIYQLIKHMFEACNKLPSAKADLQTATADSNRSITFAICRRLIASKEYGININEKKILFNMCKI